MPPVEQISQIIEGALAELERSTAALRAQLGNPRAHAHHHEEAAIAVETDARFLARLIRIASIDASTKEIRP